MESYAAFNVENAGALFRDGAEEIEKALDCKPVILGRVAVCADKIHTFIRRSQKEFEASISVALRESLRNELEHKLAFRIRNDAHLWEVLRISAKHMNNIGQAPKAERQKARTICACLSELFPHEP